MPRSANVALLIFAGAVVLATPQRALLAQVQVAADSLVAPQAAQQTPQQLQQLVAPIALYPDALVAQILAASTYPAEVVDADRWMQQHSSLKGDQLGAAVNAQSWDPSVKALAQFPDVLTNMDKNISWTSSLGDAYVNQQQDVMSAVQVMRQRAQQAGKLQTDKQEVVTTQGTTIVIEPADPSVVYVPEYDPWTIYGGPLAMYPGWVPVPGIFYAGPGFGWGLGIGIGAYAGFGWGWHNWGANWRDRDVLFNHNRYISRSNTFIDRRAMINRSPTIFDRSPRGVPGSRNGFNGRSPTVFRQPGVGGNPGMGGQHADMPGARGFTQPLGGAGFGGDHQAARGFTQPLGGGGMHSSAFSGFGHGGTSAGFSNRGQASFGGGGGGGGGFHGGGGGGGGFHGGGGGGGGHGGGGRH